MRPYARWTTTPFDGSPLKPQMAFSEVPFPSTRLEHGIGCVLLVKAKAEMMKPSLTQAVSRTLISLLAGWSRALASTQKRQWIAPWVPVLTPYVWPFCGITVICILEMPGEARYDPSPSVPQGIP